MSLFLGLNVCVIYFCDYEGQLPILFFNLPVNLNMLDVAVTKFDNKHDKTYCRRRDFLCRSQVVKVRRALRGSICKVSAVFSEETVNHYYFIWLSCGGVSCRLVRRLRVRLL